MFVLELADRVYTALCEFGYLNSLAALREHTHALVVRILTYCVFVFAIHFFLLSLSLPLIFRSLTHCPGDLFFSLPFHLFLFAMHQYSSFLIALFVQETYGKKCTRKFCKEWIERKEKNVRRKRNM